MFAVSWGVLVAESSLVARTSSGMRCCMTLRSLSGFMALSVDRTIAARIIPSFPGTSSSTVASFQKARGFESFF